MNVRSPHARRIRVCLTLPHERCESGADAYETVEIIGLDWAQPLRDQFN